jgi:hypothetical protein
MMSIVTRGIPIGETGEKTYNTMILLYYFRTEVLDDRGGEKKKVICCVNVQHVEAGC